MSKDIEQINLDELYYTDEMALLKKAITVLTARHDYKTLNTLLRRNPNASKFDTRTLNEDIPQERKLFTKSNGKVFIVTRSTPRNQEGSQCNTYISRYFDPNSKSFGYPIKS